MRHPQPWTRRSLLASAVLMMTVICPSCGRRSASQVDRGREVAVSFLDEIRAGRIEPAWQGTTVEFKSLMGADSLRDYARSHPALKAAAEFVDSRPIEASGGKLRDYEFQATLPPPKGKTKVAPGPKQIRVMINFAAEPPQVERLTSE